MLNSGINRTNYSIEESGQLLVYNLMSLHVTETGLLTQRGRKEMRPFQIAG